MEGRTKMIEECIRYFEGEISGMDGVDIRYTARSELAAIKAELAELRKDKARLDWLGDRENKIGNVQLPTAIVERNLHSMRAAIDEAMTA